MLSSPLKGFMYWNAKGRGIRQLENCSIHKRSAYYLTVTKPLITGAWTWYGTGIPGVGAEWNCRVMAWQFIFCIMKYTIESSHSPTWNPFCARALVNLSLLLVCPLWPQLWILVTGASTHRYCVVCLPSISQVPRLEVLYLRCLSVWHPHWLNPSMCSMLSRFLKSFGCFWDVSVFFDAPESAWSDWAHLFVSLFLDSVRFMIVLLLWFGFLDQTDHDATPSWQFHWFVVALTRSVQLLLSLN